MPLTTFRAEVHALLVAGLGPDVPVWDEIPDDTNELPAVVVGRVSLRRTSVAVVADMWADVWTIGRRHEAGGSDTELAEFTDRVFEALGGTRGVKSPAGELYAVARIDPRVTQVGGLDCPTYATAVEASVATC
jgi:hypothetical protein